MARPSSTPKSTESRKSARTATKPAKPAKHCVVLFSGGVESSTLLWWAHAHGYVVHALTVDYGRLGAEHELGTATAVARAHAPIAEHHALDVAALGTILGGSALTDAAMRLPTGYETPASARRTFVPNRNAILLSLAYGWAQTLGAQAVAIGVTEALYPDCNPPFLRAFARMQRAALGVGPESMTGDRRAIRLLAPWQGLYKHEVVEQALALGVPLHLTRSCLGARAQPCEHCASCLSRREAFAVNGLRGDGVPEDPVEVFAATRAPSVASAQ